MAPTLAAMPVKTPDQRNLIGKPTAALDVPAKSGGGAIYDIDVERLENYSYGESPYAKGDSISPSTGSSKKSKSKSKSKVPSSEDDYSDDDVVVVDDDDDDSYYDSDYSSSVEYHNDKGKKKKRKTRKAIAFDHDADCHCTVM